MTVRIITGHVLDALRGLPAESVHVCVTSPPYYGLRDYGIEPQVWPDGWRGSLGLEPTLDLYLDHLVEIFREVRRALRRDGTCWLNIGDSYHNVRTHKNGGQPPQGFHKDRHGQPAEGGSNRARPQAGMKEKDLMLIPARLAIRLQEDGWWVRSDIIWAKRAPMPESVTDRPTSAHEHVFLLAKSAKYFYDADAVKEEGSGRDPGNNGHAYSFMSGVHRNLGKIGPKTKVNLRNVWHLGPAPFPEAHFATFPPRIPEIASLAGCPVGGTVLDPFAGGGTSLLVADRLGRDAIGIELNPEYVAMIERRLRDDAGMFADIAAE